MSFTRSKFPDWELIDTSKSLQTIEECWYKYYRIKESKFNIILQLLSNNKIKDYIYELLYPPTIDGYIYIEQISGKYGDDINRKILINYIEYMYLTIKVSNNSFLNRCQYISIIEKINYTYNQLIDLIQNIKRSIHDNYVIV
jgi:hypothetical protein